ncbi:hypothetical protein CIK05_03955 [Bdellovibrio sp. qaytius]|nr:hypothetical protein CIK05_03955 [Bdellovibrio sp. qaytius]
MGKLRSLIIISLVAAIGSIFTGCAPKDEKTIIQERQAPVKLSESMQTTSDESILVLQKSALGKAFMMTPSMVMSKRMPDVNDFKVQIVSFERSNSRVGLFRLSSNNLYSSIPTDKLLQTFKIVKESNDSITIDISEGFRNLTLESSLNIVEIETIKENQENATSGLETTVDIKEALIRKTEIVDNVMYVEQAVRFGELSQAKNEGAGQSDNSPFKKETTAKVIIEIKPYIANTEFKSQLFDKEQRVGYFINYATLANEESLFPQITKWDISEKRGPITVALEENIPTEITDAVIEGATYWNRVIGREVLKVRKGFKATDHVNDRMIAMRWVQWDTAGFAYASMQADPMTGEILRAQVFLTSSWLTMQKAIVNQPLTGSVPLNKSGLCVLEQSKMQTTLDLANLSEKHKLKFSQDIIRTVVAHEMGHVMGLRHNFAGSFTHEGTDADLIKAQADYLKDENHPGFTFTSTVMDYEHLLHTALTGAYIKHSVLPYDSAAIGWGYKDQKIELAKDTYCSDEHITLANEQGATVYGCERFDALKNPLLGSVQQVKTDLNNNVGMTFSRLLALKNNKDPFTKVPKVEDAASLYTSIDLGQLESALFAPKDKLTVISISTAISVFQSGLSQKSKVPYETSVQSTMANDINAMGGVTGIINGWLNLEKFETQTLDFFAKLDPLNSGLEQTELVTVSTKLLASAKSEDDKFLSTVMSKFVPVYKAPYAFKSREEYDDSQVHPEKYPETAMRYRENINVGDAKVLMQLFKDAILAGKDKAKKITVNGQEIEVQTLGYSNYYRDALVKAFVLENWPASLRLEIADALRDQLQKLKEAAAANTIAILNAAGKPVPALTYAELLKAVGEIPSSQLVGIYAYELQYGDLSVLQKLENLKAE